MLTRTTDAAFFTALANRPDVRPWLGWRTDPTEAIDGAEMTTPENICLRHGDGGFCCVFVEPGVYTVHSMFPTDQRGTGTFAAIREAADYLFGEAGVSELITAVPVHNKAAKGLALAAHFEPIGVEPSAFVDTDGLTHDVKVFVLTRARWQAYTASVKEMTVMS